MGRKVEQFRYYGTGDDRNQPKGTAPISRANLQSGAIFSNRYPIVQLGIQTLPGVKFYLNKAVDPIIVGHTGIYDLELDGVTHITHLSFAEESLKMLENTANSYLIVDIIHEGLGGI